MDGTNRLLRKSGGFGWLVTCAHERISECASPFREVATDRISEAITCVAECKSADEADTLARLKVRFHGLHHERDACLRVCRGVQRQEHALPEPGIDVVEDSACHLLLPTGEKVIEAALAQSGCLADERQTRTVIAVFAKHVRESRERVRALSDDFRYGTTS